MRSRFQPVLLGLALVAALGLSACSLTMQPYLTDPSKYGLFVASTWVYAHASVCIPAAKAAELFGPDATP
ncbi:MAG TPA: hypothetical protein VGM47_03845 [Gammaproteobacteria bacterium]